MLPTADRVFRQHALVFWRNHPDTGDRAMEIGPRHFKIGFRIGLIDGEVDVPRVMSLLPLCV
jgi:hypothetical protein